jgi:hypothetical protein
MTVRKRLILAMIGCPLLLLISFAIHQEFLVSSLLSLVAIWLGLQIAWAKCPSCGTKVGNPYPWPPKDCWNCHGPL